MGFYIPLTKMPAMPEVYLRMTENGTSVLGKDQKCKLALAVILLSCFPISPEILWNRYKEHICDDLR